MCVVVVLFVMKVSDVPYTCALRYYIPEESFVLFYGSSASTTN